MSWITPEAEKHTIRNFLESIQDDIEMIDGGCPSCISDFCEGINDSLEKYNIKIEYDKYEDSHIKITDI